MENFQINSTIKTWAEDDRPREKLLNLGRANLSDAELVAIVLGSGTRNKSAVELAQEILQTCGNNLYQLGKMNLSELTKFKGVGEAKAVNIMAVRESIGRVGRGGFRKRLCGWLAGTFGMQIHSFGDEG